MSVLENLGDVSDEQGERFLQDISDMEVHYQSHWDATMLADYCWSIKRDDARASHSRISVQRQFMANDVYVKTFLERHVVIVNIWCYFLNMYHIVT